MNSTARKAATLLVAITIISGPFASSVSIAGATPVSTTPVVVTPTCTDTQTLDVATNTCVDNPVTPPVVTIPVVTTPVVTPDCSGDMSGNVLLVNKDWNISNDPDSSVTGPNWALDNFTRTVRIWSVNGGSYYCGEADDNGTFTTNGTISPQGGAALPDTVTGTMVGGTGRIVIQGKFNISSTPLQDVDCSVNATECANGLTGFWMNNYFGSTFVYNNWSWVYTSNCGYGTWTNAAAGNQGDILETTHNTCTPPVVIPDNFKISGKVFNDLDNSGTISGGDTFLKDWEVHIHQGDKNGPVITPIDFTDVGGNFFYENLQAGEYYVEEIVKNGWNEISSDTKVSLSSTNSDVTVNFANVQTDQGGNGGTGGSTGSTTPPTTPTTITVDASNVVCTNSADLPTWGKGGNGPITATTAKDWVAAHPSCSLSAGWNFDYAYQYTPYGGDTTIGHDNDFTAFGPTTTTGSTTVTFTPASTTAIQVRSQLQDGYIPFTFTADPTNNTTPSAQMYCNSDVLNYDNGDFIFNPVVGSTYYCVAFNAPKTATTGNGGGNGSGGTPAPIITNNTSGGGNGGGGGIISGPLSIGFVNTNTGGGLVLGTSTEATDGATCSTPLLSTFMRQGKNNNKSEVTKLQNFLNNELGMHLPVTGFFGPMTTAAVNAFQTKYQNEVLAPWAPFGLNGTPTGYVYKTTEHKINMLSCSNLNIPAPQLP